jgi:hypothetical protein
MDKDRLRDLGTDEMMTGVLKWIRSNSMGTLLTCKVSSDLDQRLLTDQSKCDAQNIRRRIKSKYVAILPCDKFVSSWEAL